MEIVSGGVQTGTAFMPLAQPLVIRAVDEKGNPVPDQTVSFTVIAGGGTIIDADQSTGADGIASARWELGDNSSAEQRARAAALNADGDTLAVAEFTARTPLTATMEVVSGAGQEGFALMALPQPITVRAVDSEGNPVPSQRVEVTIVAGGGKILDADERTGADGVASARWELGVHSTVEQRAQVIALDAGGDTLATAEFAASSLARANEVSIVGGFRQSGRVGQDLPVVVQSTDAMGNPLEGQRILFVVNPGDGTFSVTDTVTDAEGIARSVLTLSRGDLRDRLAWVYAVHSEQDNFVFARSDFVVTALPGPAASLSVAGPSDTMNLGLMIPFPISAADQDGNSISIPDSAIASSNPAIAAVDSGRIVARAFGSAWIVASLDGLRDSAQVTVAPLEFAAVASHRDHTCALTTSGRGYCWGLNNVGNLGIGTATSTSSTRQRGPWPLDTTTRFKDIDVGSATGCGLAVDDSVFCWGSFIGAPDPMPCSGIPCSRSPQLVSGTVKFRSIADRCGVAYDDRAYCFDDGSPDPVMPDLRFRQVATTERSVCGVTLEGQLFCLENGVRTRMDNGFSLTALDVGQNHMCALNAAGQALCSGSDLWGQLGRPGASGTMATSAEGIAFSEISVSGPAFNQFGFTCGVATDGTAYCWGLNRSGQLGLGDRVSETCHGLQPCEALPLPVVGNARFSTITTGVNHSCGLTTDGILYCWGSNWAGQLGVPADTDASTCAAGDCVRRPTAVLGQRVRGTL